jgi:hypothetical protein
MWLLNFEYTVSCSSILHNLFLLFYVDVITIYIRLLTFVWILKPFACNCIKNSSKKGIGACFARFNYSQHALCYNLFIPHPDELVFLFCWQVDVRFPVFKFCLVQAAFPYNSICSAKVGLMGWFDSN